MKLFGSRHEHRWENVTATFSPPQPVTSAKGSDPTMLAVLLYGVTTIRQKCAGCRQERLEWAPGKAIRTFDVLYTRDRTR